MNICKYLSSNHFGPYCTHPENLTHKPLCESPCMFLLLDRLVRIEDRLKKINKKLEISIYKDFNKNRFGT